MKDLGILNFMAILLIFEVAVIQSKIKENPQSQPNEVDMEENDQTLPEISTRRVISSNPEDINFYSFPEKTKPETSRLITTGSSATLFNSGLIPDQKITIIVHGFYGGVKESDTNNSVCPPLKNVYLANNFENIVCVDWAELAKPTVPEPFGQLQYLEVVKNVEIVGEKLARFILFLVETKYISGPEMIHLVGHSIGSHICGSAGKFVLQKLRKKIHRITALDPAGPIYYPFKPKLNKADAEFVDCIHTNIDFFGSAESLGHADFFVNGGVGNQQPGCEDITVIDELFTQRGSCAHVISFMYYAKTIRGEKFIGCKCLKNPYEPFKVQCSTTRDGSCKKPALYGEFGSERARGKYYITVRKTW